MMETTVVKEEKDSILLELKGETRSFANLIREELWNDSNVLEAAAIKSHPYKSEPRIFVKMRGRSDPKKALKEAVKRLNLKLKTLDAEMSRALKK
jgi:DNA-directed RNA polymerase subunit L